MAIPSGATAGPKYLKIYSVQPSRFTERENPRHHAMQLYAKLLVALHCSVCTLEQGGIKRGRRFIIEKPRGKPDSLSEERPPLPSLPLPRLSLIIDPSGFVTRPQTGCSAPPEQILLSVTHTHTHGQNNKTTVRSGEDEKLFFVFSLRCYWTTCQLWIESFRERRAV